MLLPRLVLRHHRIAGTGSLRNVLRDRCQRFWSGDWDTLLRDGLHSLPARVISKQRSAADQARRAQDLVREGTVSRAGSSLVSPGLAPGNAATHAVLSDAERRPRMAERPLPEAPVTREIHLERSKLFMNIRCIKRGSAPGRSGWRGEHFRLLLEATDPGALDLFADVADLLANARVPEEARAAIALGGLTPLNKLDEAGDVIGVRGICTGDLLRRLVARTLAQTYNAEFCEATAPAQVALGTRAGMDAAILTARTALQMDMDLVLVSLDGIGAYDHVFRSAMFFLSLALSARS